MEAIEKQSSFDKITSTLKRKKKSIKATYKNGTKQFFWFSHF